MLLSLLDRRVPQVVGVYLAASWGCVEFSDFAVNQFALSPAITNLVVLTLGLLLPAVVVLAWRHGAPGAQGWTKTDGAVIGLNLVVAAGVVFVVFGGQELGAATTVKLVEDLEGNTVERVIPKAEFRRSVLVYDFDNETGDPDLDWLRKGVPFGLAIDLVQDVFVTTSDASDATVKEQLAEAGFGYGDRVPLTLKREAAERRSMPYFMSGVIRRDGATLVIETLLYDTNNARQLAAREYSGPDVLSLSDQISVDLRADLGIPDWQLDEAVDLPAAELLTTSAEAFRALVEAQILADRNDVLGARAKAEAAIAHDSTFAMAYLVAGMTSMLAGDPATGNEFMEAASSYAYRLPERTRLDINVIDNWFFKRDPQAATRTARYWTEVYPQDADARRLLANLASATGDLDETISQSRALLAIDTADASSMRQLASAFRQRQDYDSALLYYERLGDRLPSDVQTRLDVAATRSSLGQFEEAREELERASIAEPTDPDPIDRLARLDMREGRYEDAAERTERVSELARTPRQQAAVAGLEESLYYNRGLISRLDDAYRRRLASNLEFNPVINVIGGIVNSEALLYAAESGREDWALSQLDSLRSLDQSAFSLILENAAVRIHLDLGDLAAARASLQLIRQRGEELASGFGGNAFISYVEGRIAEIEDSDCESAIGKYDEALDEAPLSPEYRVSRLQCLTALQRWRDAQTEADWLVERVPGSAKYRLAIARYYAARGDTARAIEHLEVATDIWSEADADYIPAQEARALLAELRGA
jgi:tetratricopeptide (TPR) repeat protein